MILDNDEGGFRKSKERARDSAAESRPRNARAAVEVGGGLSTAEVADC